MFDFHYNLKYTHQLQAYRMSTFSQYKNEKNINDFSRSIQTFFTYLR